jgi:hypothetical protein
VGLEGAKP